MAGENNQVKWRGVQPVSGIRGIWPAIDALRINKAAYRTSIGTTVIYTAPAGKLVFLSNVCLTSRHTASGSAYPNIEIRNAAGVRQIEIITHYYTLAGQMTTVHPYMPALEMEAGWDVVLKISTANTVVRGFVHGWQEDA